MFRNERARARGIVAISTSTGSLLGAAAVAGTYPVLFPMIVIGVMLTGALAANVLALSILTFVGACVVGAGVGALIGWGVGAAINFFRNRNKPVVPQPVVLHHPVVLEPDTTVNLLNALPKQNLSVSLEEENSSESENISEVEKEKPLSESNVNDIRNDKLKEWPEHVVAPEWAVCPITKKPMKHPVLNKLDNLTYEREAIAAQLAEDFVDMSEKDINAALVSDIALRDLIVDYQNVNFKIEAVANPENPSKNLTCPISLDLMTKPVLLITDGRTYDETWILMSLRSNLVTPSNGLEIKLQMGEKLEDLLVPNKAFVKVAEHVQNGDGYENTMGNRPK
jgi:uncharacterized membrane protein required for colicin V production